jgi:large subunit ribosomal protein L21
MFAVVRTGGKQYRVAAGDKIAVEKIPGEAGDSVTLSDVLLAGTGGDVKAADGLTVAAEIVAQAKGEKVIVFKKRRRHNYRRKKGHRQQYTILRITAIGDQKAAPSQARAAAEDGGKVDTKKSSAPKKGKASEGLVAQEAPLKVEGAEGPIDTPAAAKPQVETADADAPAVSEAPAKDEATAGEVDAPKKKSTKKAKPAKGEDEAASRAGDTGGNEA